MTASAPVWKLPEAFQELLADGERPAIVEFMDLFLDGLPTILRHLEHTCANRDADSALKGLHQLKGSSLQIGAERLAAVTLKAEKFVRSSPSETGYAAKWLLDIRSCLRLTETEVRNRRDELSLCV